MSARGIAARVVKVASAAFDRVAPPPPGIVVLGYHQVGAPQPGPVNIDPAAFADQVAWLAEAAAPLSLDAAADLLDEPPTPDAGPRGPRPVVVTFDDGTADFVDVALPILERHGVPVTLYLATRWVEEGRSFWDDGTVLTWGALAEAVATGLVTVGCHTHGHLLLDRTPGAEVAADLDRAVGLVADRLGVRAEHFAYPKALAPSAAAAAAVATRFRTAALAGPRPNRPGLTDLQRLARPPVPAADTPARVRRKADGGLRLEGTVRATVDRRRHAGASR